MQPGNNGSTSSYDQPGLPTDAQWEYACRAGSQTRFYFGDDEKELVDYAWFKTNAGPGVAGYGTHPIGEKNKPNGYGLHDMHGNVFNWCQDWYGKRYYSTSPINDPKGPVEGEIVKSLNSVARVMRGGSWSHLAEYCRSGHRDHDAPGDRYSDLGFRVVIAYPDQ
jgi:formylglycine-generating enzyme required for sulfatase activity